MGNIPIIINPLPDEMLFSWIHRLSEANGLNISVFGKEYLYQKGIYTGELPYDIRHEFVYLCQNMLYDFDYARLYTEHTLFRFDALFHTKKKNYKMANCITMHTDEINHNLDKSVTSICVCPECLKEDKEKYGESYLHVGHNVGNITFCKKHSARLLKYKGKSQRIFDFDPKMFTPVKLSAGKDAEYKYSCFVDDLYNSDIEGSVEDIKRAMLIRLQELGYSLHREGYDKFEHDYDNSGLNTLSDKDLRYCIDNYMLKKKTFPCHNLIPILMFLFENVDNLSKYMEKSEPLLKNVVCRTCTKKFLSVYDEQYSMGLCPDCYATIPLQQKFDNIINVSNDGTYKVLTPFISMSKRIKVKHSCGIITSVIPNNFIYAESACSCNKVADDLWDKHFELLKEYKEKYGTANIPKRNSFKGVKLGQWCQKMRRFKTNGILTKEREDALLGIGFDFSPFDSSWEGYFELYREYVEISGSGHVKRGTVYKGVDIGNWYNNNRGKYNKGRMQEERLRKIKEIYPDFPELPPKPIKEEKPRRKIVRFDEAVELLLKYNEENGTMNIPKRKKYGGYKLGIWANQMRSKRHQGILPTEQIEKLNDIGFDWYPLKTKWKSDIKRYQDYVNETSKVEIPKEATYNGFAIGYWYSNLKISRKNNSLSAEQISDIIQINPNFI